MSKARARGRRPSLSLLAPRPTSLARNRPYGLSLPRPLATQGAGFLSSIREAPMIALDLRDKVALVTGVGDNESFAWFISKTLQAAGARIVLGVHPRMVRIVEGFLTSDKSDDVESRILPYGAGTFTVDKTYPCDVSFDTMADVPEATRTDRRYTRIEEQYG